MSLDEIRKRDEYYQNGGYYSMSISAAHEDRHNLLTLLDEARGLLERGLEQSGGAYDVFHLIEDTQAFLAKTESGK